MMSLEKSLRQLNEGFSLQFTKYPKFVSLYSRISSTLNDYKELKKAMMSCTFYSELSKKEEDVLLETYENERKSKSKSKQSKQSQQSNNTERKESQPIFSGNNLNSNSKKREKEEQKEKEKDNEVNYEEIKGINYNMQTDTSLVCSVILKTIIKKLLIKEKDDNLILAIHDSINFLNKLKINFELFKEVVLEYSDSSTKNSYNSLNSKIKALFLKTFSDYSQYKKILKKKGKDKEKEKEDEKTNKIKNLKEIKQIVTQEQKLEKEKKMELEEDDESESTKEEVVVEINDYDMD